MNAFDFTCSAPMSFPLLLVQASPEEREAILKVHHEAVDKALEYVESKQVEHPIVQKSDWPTKA